MVQFHPTGSRSLVASARFALVALALSACAGTGKSPETPKDAGASPEPVAPVANPVPAPPTPTPQELYAQCQDRVEKPQADGECKTDADCATAGCGGEVCTTLTEKANINTTCEERHCFKVLDQCGCHEGHCTWTLKAQTPPMNPLPSSLPLTGPPKGDKAIEPAPVPPAP